MARASRSFQRAEAAHRAEDRAVAEKRGSGKIFKLPEEEGDLPSSISSAPPSCTLFFAFLDIANCLSLISLASARSDTVRMRQECRVTFDELHLPLQMIGN